MKLFNNSIENAIIETLSKGSVASPKLVKDIADQEKVTFQGVYKAISTLLERNIITKTRMVISLNILWLEQLSTFTTTVSQNYVLNEFNDFLFLDDREKVTYNFQDAEKLDDQWLHFLLMIAKKLNEHPIFIWNPHHWFIFAREQEESVLFNWLNSNQKNTFLLIGDNSVLDVLAKNKLVSDKVRVNLDVETTLPNNKYYVVVNDYIMTTVYAPEFLNEVETIFSSYTENIETGDILWQLIQKPLRGKIIMERNKKKALKLSKQISKDFFLDKETRLYLKQKTDS